MRAAATALILLLIGAIDDVHGQGLPALTEANRERISAVATDIEVLVRQSSETREDRQLEALRDSLEELITDDHSGSDAMVGEISRQLIDQIAERDSASVVPALAQSIEEELVYLSSTTPDASAQDQAAVSELVVRYDRAVASVLPEEIGAFCANVTDFFALGAQFTALAGVAEGLLLLPENSPLSGGSIMRYLGAAGGLVAAVPGALEKFGVSADDVAATRTTVLSFSLLASLGADFIRSNQVVRNVARNVGFTDDVRAYSRIAAPFTEKAESLREQTLRGCHTSPKALPAIEQLHAFHGLISMQKDINANARRTLANAELLKRTLLKEDPKLNDIIERLNNAIRAWEVSEPEYLDRYNYLLGQHQNTR
ncbi:MAG TPA: hypothetical protein VF006_32250 [Longimicrobium sp.]